MKSIVSIVLSAAVTAVTFGGLALVWKHLEVPPSRVEVVETKDQKIHAPEVPKILVEESEEHSEKDEEAAENLSTIGGEPEPAPSQIESEPQRVKLPFVMHVGPHEGGLMMQGSIPSKELLGATLDAAKSSVPEREVFNRMKFSPNTEVKPWLFLLPEFVRIYFKHSGPDSEMVIVDNRLILNGHVRDENSVKTLSSLAEFFCMNTLSSEVKLEVDSKLLGTLPPFPEESYSLAARALSEGEVEVDSLPTASTDEQPASPAIYGPFVGPFEEVTQSEVSGSAEEEYADADRETVYVSISDKSREKPKLENEESATMAPSPEPLKDDGKPLIFYFDTGSAEIKADDREKIQRAIQRASTPRSIVYITAYAD